MMIGNLKKSIALLSAALIAVVMILIVNSDFASAATASMSLSGGGNVEKGGKVSVTLSYSGATFGSATASVTYNSEVLEYVSCSGAEAGGGGGNVRVTMANGTGTKTLSCTLTFKAKKAGTSSITATTSDIYNIDLEELSAGSKSTSVTVKNNQTAASTNTNLAYMYISAGNLSPAFSKNVTSYTVKIPYEVTTFLITAECEDSRSTLSVTGSTSMKVGTNTRKVTVTSESGKSKTYTITIMRAEAAGGSGGSGDDESKPQGNKPQETEPQKPVAIETVVKGKTYIIEEDFTDIEIPIGFSIAEANYNDKKIPVVKSNDRKISMGLLKAKNSDDIGNSKWFFYAESKNMFYEKKSLTCEQLASYGQSIAEIAAKQEVQESKPKEEPKSHGFEITSENIMYYAFGLTLGVLLLVVIGLQVVVIRSKSKK